MDKTIHVARFFSRNIVLDLEVFDLTTDKPCGLNLVKLAIPDLPANKFSQAIPTWLPTGLTNPKPVITTRRWPLA
jgi:hypothetical protein